jgi:hypothetical protein
MHDFARIDNAAGGLEGYCNQGKADTFQSFHVAVAGGYRAGFRHPPRGKPSRLVRATATDLGKERLIRLDKEDAL